MIRLMIVEDEQIIRNGLVRHMPWEDLGIGEILAVANADEALSACGSFRPDIIVSDIRMPGINGIELCVRIRKTLPHSQIIFISGFSDKEYLLAAIRLGAVSYVEKPLSVEDLCEAVKKAADSVRRFSNQKTNLLHTLLSPGALDDRETRETLLQNGSDWLLESGLQFWVGILKTQRECRVNSEFYASCKKNLEQTAPGCSVHLAADQTGKAELVLLFSADDRLRAGDTARHSAVCEGILSAYKQNGACFLGVGEKADSPGALAESYRTAAEAVKSLAYKGWNQYAFYSEPRSEYKEELSQNVLGSLYRQLIDGESGEVQSFFDRLYDRLTAAHTVMNFYIRNMYHQISNEIQRAEKITSAWGTQTAPPETAFPDEAQTIREMHEAVSGRALACCRKDKDACKNNSAVKSVVNYLTQNPGNKNISIQMLADMVYLTPTYLSGIFKRHTGMTIGHYLTKIRIAKAEEYLADPQFKLYQIAGMVGFEDANYFSKAFKKQTGMLPSEYREGNLP